MLSSKLSCVYPEIWLFCLSCLALMTDLYLKRWAKWTTYFVSQAALVGVMFFAFGLIGKKPSVLFYNAFIMDDIAALLKFMIAGIGFFVCMYSRKFVFESPHYRGEYFVLCLFSILGMLVLVSARSFLSLYLGIELFALPLYALITMLKDDSIGPEAAMKYFIMGALASGLMLYGISLVYGITGSFAMPEIATILFQNPALHANPALLFGVVFIVAGFAFKFGAVPFHMWLPDVYEGSSIAVTLFLGTLPKLAAFGFAIRLFSDTFLALAGYWQGLLMVMAVLSLLIGNVAAIAQTNLKRMLGYSTIAHMGFLFLGLLAAPQQGYVAALNYIIVYTLMALGVFGILTALSRSEYEIQNIHDLKGLGVRYPWIAFLLMMLLFSLAGIPPFAGFYAKLFVLDVLMKAGHMGLAIPAVLLTVVGVFYYLRVVRVMFFEVSDAQPVHAYRIISKPGVALLSLNSLAILMLGIFPTPLFNVCSGVFAWR